MRKKRLAVCFLTLLLVAESVNFIFHKAHFIFLLKDRLGLGVKGFFLPQSVMAATNATINATIKISVCGNNIKENGEECDGSDLAGQNCISRGYGGGTLSCNPSCTFNTSNCTASTGGGGDGGGGGYPLPPSSATGVTFTGRAYPKSTITLLKDAQVAATTVAGTDANFQLTISNLSGGSYIFSVYSEDNKGNRSSLLTFPVSITAGTTTNISGIFIAPTIAVDKEEVKRGDNIAIFGQSVPKAEITIAVSSDKEFFGKTLADANGVYLYNFDTAQLEMGQHFTKSKAVLNGEVSSFSKAISFKVGVKTIIAKPTTEPLRGDLNNDKKVNLVDFSIAAYWYKRPNPAKAADLNSDGKVDLVDLSIMAYYWTG